MIFENIDIDIDSLPQLDSNSFIALEKKYRNVLVLKSIVFAIVLIIGFTTYYYYQSHRMPKALTNVLFVLLIFIIIGNLLVAYYGYKKKKYLLRKHDITYKTGILWRSETSIPFVRVQHSEVIQGPIERAFRLAKLKLYTAGGHSSDLSVPGLSLQQAQQLKDFITGRIQEEEE